MKYTIVPARSLAPEHVRAWSALQERDPSLASPFLRPEFTQAVAAVRDDAYVAILEDEEGIAAFFPFQRGRSGVGEPVGEWLNDLQGTIGRAGAKYDAAELMRRCALRAWRFERLLAAQEAFAPFHLRRHASASIDLSNGFDAYAAARRAAGTHIVRKVDACERRLARAHGEVRFAPHSAARSDLAALMGWKLARYGGRGYEDVFAVPWARALVERVHATHTPQFGGMLCVLYAGDEPVAALLGLHSRTLWHGWLPAYDAKFARYSPGLVLLLRMARFAPQAGFTAMDLGGPEGYEYKRRLMSGSVALAEGTVERFALLGAARRMRHSGEEWIRGSRVMHPMARGAARLLRKAREAVS